MLGQQGLKTYYMDVDKVTQSLKRKRKYGIIYQDYKYIHRANDPSKPLSKKARELASHYMKLINKSKMEAIFLTHDFISTITEVTHRQNNNIHMQLDDIFSIAYHKSVILEGRKYRNGFIVTYNVLGREILENPKAFYDNESDSNELNLIQDSPVIGNIIGSKLPDNQKEISTNYYIRENNSLKRIRNRSIKSSFNQSEVEDLSTSYDIEAHTVASLEESKKVQEEEITAPAELKAKPAWRGRELAEFHPLSQEDGDALCSSSKREFSLRFINKLLLRLARKYLNRLFYSKNAVLRYMSKALSFEMRQAPVVNNENFVFREEMGEGDMKRSKEERIQRYLSEVEGSLKTDYVAQLRRKIAGVFNSNTAYKLLTSCSFIGVEGSNYKIELYKPVEITDFTKTVLLEVIASVYGPDIVGLQLIHKFTEPKIGINDNSSGKSNSPPIDLLESMDPESIWYQVRKSLRERPSGVGQEYYFDNLEVVEENMNKKVVILKPDSHFTGRWVRDNFGMHLCTAFKSLGFTFEIMEV